MAPRYRCQNNRQVDDCGPLKEKEEEEIILTINELCIF